MKMHAKKWVKRSQVVVVMGSQSPTFVLLSAHTSPHALCGFFCSRRIVKSSEDEAVVVEIPLGRTLQPAF